MYSVVVKSIELICMTLIPLNDYTPIQGTLASRILMQAPIIGIVASEMLVHSRRGLGSHYFFDMLFLA